MKTQETIKKVDINSIISPWGNEKKIQEQVRSAIDNMSESPQPFKCIKCGAQYKPAPYQWIFYKLCDVCFRLFDKQKMIGRIATLSRKGRYVKHYEDVDEWIKHSQGN